MCKQHMLQGPRVVMCHTLRYNLKGKQLGEVCGQGFFLPGATLRNQGQEQVANYHRDIYARE
jgi:hypothetical protein